MGWVGAIDPGRWPGQCECCRRWTRGRLCAACGPQVAALRCAGCGLRVGQPVARCGTCLDHPLPLLGCWCAVDYGAPWDSLIARFKYHQGADLAGLLASRLADGVPADAAAGVDLVLPMPLAPRRLAERGYNQAWELARRVARRHGRAASARLLQRTREAPPQAGLDRAARQRNLHGAFAVADAGALAGRHLALVDDVMTTGASIGEAARTLLAAGAASVQAWVLARTP